MPLVECVSGRSRSHRGAEARAGRRATAPSRRRPAHSPLPRRTAGRPRRAPRSGSGSRADRAGTGTPRWSGRCSSWTSRSVSLTPVPERRPPRERRPRSRMPRSRLRPKTSGRPCSSTSVWSLLRALSVRSSKAPSLKTLQFWRISTNDAPRCACARRRISCRCLASTSTLRATKVAVGAEGQGERVERMVDRAERRRLGDLADLGGRRVLALGQAVDPVVEQRGCSGRGCGAARGSGGCRRSTARRRRP